MSNSTTKERLQNYRKKNIISSSNKMKLPLYALKTDHLCWLLKKSKKHLKDKLWKSSNTS